VEVLKTQTAEDVSSTRRVIHITIGIHSLKGTFATGPPAVVMKVSYPTLKPSTVKAGPFLALPSFLLFGFNTLQAKHVHYSFCQ
jgi:hypothetical protein